jgi:hypothetical protein
MRLFFSGSLRHLQGSGNKGHRASFKEASVEIGNAAARRRHTILVTTESRRTVDYYLVQGAQALGTEGIQLPTVEIHKMLGRPRPFRGKGWDSVRFEHVVYHQVPQPERKQLGARIGAVVSCDAVVLIGGGTGTELVSQLAADLHKPIVAIPSFLGSASRIFEQLGSWYMQMPEVASRANDLLTGWREHESADIAIDIAEALSGRHSYFISYAHGNHVEADHIEALLRRRSRPVFRDERELQFTDEIKCKLDDAISQTNTFIALWSEQSRNSEWCAWERQSAERHSQKSEALKRIVFLQLDHSPLPSGYEAFVQADATTREGRNLTVRRLIEEESRHFSQRPGGKT